MYMERNSKDKFRICFVQTTSYKGGKEYNLERAAEAIRAAAEGGASMVVFPEMYLTGYESGARLLSVCEPASGPSFEVMAGLAAENKVHLVYGYPESRDGCIFNSVNLIDDKGVLTGTYSKSRLFEEEKKYFTAGSEYPVFDTVFGKTGMLICYDLEFPEPARRLAAKGAGLIICIAANMAPFHELHARMSLVRAVENSAFIAYCNFTGKDDIFEYTGRSGLYEPDGQLLSGTGRSPENGGLAEGLIFADVDRSKYRSDETVYDYISQISEEETAFYQS